MIMWLAQHMDLIFVFMDPVGQALCTRTMAVVNALDVRRNASTRPCARVAVIVLLPCTHGVCGCA